MGALRETSGAVVIHSKELIEDRLGAELTSEHIKWSGNGRGEAAVLGFLLTSSRLAGFHVWGHAGAWNLVHEPQVPVCLRGQSITRQLFIWRAYKPGGSFNVFQHQTTSALHSSINDEDRARLQLVPNSFPLLLANHSARVLTDNGLSLPPLASSSAA